jgi:uncharacterized protein
MLEIGVISDTHGLLRSEVIEALQGCWMIIHAGDEGKSEILYALRRMSPFVAVRGNVDRETWAQALPESDIVQAEEAAIYVINDLHQMDLDPSTAGLRAVISGHSHQPRIEEKGNVLYLNPGSAARAVSGCRSRLQS